jgi:hypothetical protein
MLMTPADGLTVRFATLVFAFQFAAATVQVPLPIVSVFVPDPRAKLPIEMFHVPAFNVPFVKVRLRVEPKAVFPWKVNVPPTPLNMTGMSNVTPLVFIACDDVDPNVVVKLPLNVIPAESVKFP